MVKISFWLIVLFVFAFIFAAGSLSFSIWTYGKGYGTKLSAHSSSSEASIGFFVEGSGSFCGDILCNGAETCSTCSADCGACAGTGSGSSGGGGGGAVFNFIVIGDEFNMKIVSGESETNEAIIKNTGTKSITISVDVTDIGKYISFNMDSITIAPGKSASLVFTVNAPEPGIYTGKIILKYQGITREVFIAVNVISEGVLFDTAIILSELYRIVGAGQRLPAIIEIAEIGGKTKVDVTINYLIKDFDGETRFTETETFFVFGMKKYNKIFYTNGLEPGNYVLGIEVIYPGGFATSSTPFTVSTDENLFRTWVIFGILFMTVVFIILLIIFIRRHDEQEDYKLKERVK